MLILFYILGLAMIIAALALVLMPILRRGRQCGRPRGVFGLVLVLAFVLPLSAIGVYVLVGTPSAVLASVRKPPPDMSVDQAIAQLKQHLAQSPNDVQGWLVLGRTYTAMKEPADARDAYAHALALKSDDADILVAWVEADSLARPDHRIQGTARKRLQKALQIDAHNQRGLWLMGISDYQAGHFVDAALVWRRLQVLLPPDGDVADAVSRQIAMANARAAGKSQAEAQKLLQPAASGTRGGATDADAKSPRIVVKVSLSPTLKDKIDDGDVLFVYAHAVDGSPVPLAIKRLKASQLPTTVTLTDAMSMTPGHDLSSARKVALTARVSRSGKAAPQAGDLEGDAGPLTVGNDSPVRVIIDRTL